MLKKILSKGKQLIQGMKTEITDIVKDESAAAVDVGVSAVVGGAIAIGVGAMIYARISPKITGTDDVSNATIKSLNETVWSSFDLLPMVLFLTVAGLLIGVVYWFTSGNRSN
ncbi:MAG: hypothetical protein LBU81_06375 [Methanosarcinales archaeon]|jgi:hypothetical protein|nr:hypothetical protein [Methanosarcinales archaeon]